jgi:hypothetical protein
MSWFTQYILDPIKAAIATPGSPANAAATSTTSTLETLVIGALGEVNPLIDEATTGLEGVLNGFLSKYGALGTAAAGVGDAALSTAATAFKALIDSKLGVSSAS